MTRFAHLGRDARNCVYVAEFSTGVVKVGFSNNPSQRLRRLSMILARSGETISRYEVFYGAQVQADWRHDPQRNELRAIRAMQAIAPAIAGTSEYFDRIPYETALAIVAAEVRA